MAHELRPFQGDAVNDLRTGFKNGHKRQLLAFGTGLGKTYTISHIIHKVAKNGKKALFIVHTTELVHQSVKHLEMFGLRVGVLQGENSFQTSRDEVLVATIQSLRSRGVPPVEFVVIDEAHILHKAHIDLMMSWDNLPFIGLSGTPLRPDLGKYFTNLVKGPSIQEATDMGYLVPAKALCPSNDMIKNVLSGVKSLADDYNQKQLSKAVNVKVIIGSIVSTWQKNAPDRKTLVFAVDIAHSKSIIEDFVAVGVSAIHLDAYTDADTRKEIIAKFKAGKVQVLSSVNVLGIGFDDPSASCAILARPTNSEALHFQQVGRIIRSCEGKTDALILDHAGNTVKFGLPIHFEIPELTNEDYQSSNAKPKVKDKQVVCGNCSAVIDPSATQCDQCGMDRQVRPSNVEHYDGKLIEYGSDDSGEVKFTHKDKREWYAAFLWTANRSGYQKGWASHQFKTKFGDWPNFRNVEPKQPTHEQSNWLKYQQIKKAKSWKKRNHQPKKECSVCKSKNVDVSAGKGPHAGALKCHDCGSHRWLSKNSSITQAREPLAGLKRI